MPQKTFRQAINDALVQEMRSNPEVILIGEDIAEIGRASCRERV